MRTVLTVLLLTMANGAAAQPVPAAVAAPATAAGGRIAAAKAAMMGDPKTALDHARAAAALAAGPSEPPASLAEARWLEGEALARLNRLDEAKPIVDEALVLAERGRPGPGLVADILRSRATIELAQGRVRTALADYQRAFRLFQAAGDARKQAITLLDLGAIYGEARDHARALRYYEQAAETYSGDPAVALSITNGRATELKAQGDLAGADAAFRAALAHARAMESPFLAARILANLASVQFLAGRAREADQTARAGLAEAARAPGSGWEPHLWGVRAQVAAAGGDLDRAELLIARTFAGADLARTTLDFRDFHAAAERIYAQRGRPELALAHLRALKRLDDEAGAVVASASAALAGARFDFANQNLRIAELRSGQLERDVALARSRGRLQKVTIYGVIGVATIVLLGVMLALRQARRGRDRVAAINEDLTDANTSLDRALKAKSEFLATTSHEIRTPLNGILGMTQLMLVDPRIDATQRERVAIVHGAGETMKALVDDLLDVAKIEHGELTMEVSEIEIAKMLGEVVGLWATQAEAKGVAVETDLTRLPPRIVAQGRQLRQIAFNLVSNAVKFTPTGTIRLEASVYEGAGGPRLMLRLSDTGIGIPEDEFEPIFEPFHQVDGGTTRQYGGTGLGLAICRNFSRAMGGDVTVASRLGEGSVFTLDVPVAVAEAPAAPADAGWPETLAQSTVVVVDSNPLRQSMLGAVLEDNVARLVLVEDDYAALVELARGPVHHIVLAAAAEGPGPALAARLATLDRRTTLSLPDPAAVALPLTVLALSADPMALPATLRRAAAQLPLEATPCAA